MPRPKPPEPHPYCVAAGVPGHTCAPAGKLARFGAHPEHIIDTEVKNDGKPD
jgi:hypothetical protein